MNDSQQVESLVMDGKTRAQLRRFDPWEVPGAYTWMGRVRRIPELAMASDTSLMATASLIAEVREDRSGTLGAALRGVSETRVRRLLASERGDDLCAQLGHMVRILKRSVPIADVIATVVYWGDHRRRKIAQDYFAQDDSDGG